MANQNQPQILPLVAKPIVFKKPRSINVDLTRLNPLAKEQIPSCTSYESKLNFSSTVRSINFNYPFYSKDFARLANLINDHLTTITTEPRFLWDFVRLSLKTCSLYHEKLFIQVVNDISSQVFNKLFQPQT